MLRGVKELWEVLNIVEISAIRILENKHSMHTLLFAFHGRGHSSRLLCHWWERECRFQWLKYGCGCRVGGRSWNQRWCHSSTSCRSVKVRHRRWGWEGGGRRKTKTRWAGQKGGVGR